MAKGSKKKGCLGAALGAVFVVIVIAALASSGGSAKFSARFQARGITPVSATQVTVFVTVRNTGTKAGTPTCTIDLNTPGGDHGVDSLTPEHPIAAGKQESYSDTITVTGGAAASVSEALSTVTC